MPATPLYAPAADDRQSSSPTMMRVGNHKITFRENSLDVQSQLGGLAAQTMYELNEGCWTIARLRIGLNVLGPEVTLDGQFSCPPKAVS